MEQKLFLWEPSHSVKKLKMSFQLLSQTSQTAGSRACLKKSRKSVGRCKTLNDDSVCEARPPSAGSDQELSGDSWVPKPSLAPIHHEADPSAALQWASPVNRSRLGRWTLLSQCQNWRLKAVMSVAALSEIPACVRLRSQERNSDLWLVDEEDDGVKRYVVRIWDTFRRGLHAERTDYLSS